MIKLGPAGIGSSKNIEETLEFYKKNNFQLAEVAFVSNIYLKKEEAKKIKEINKKFKIELSIHAPYYINLNSLEKSKIEASKKRILKCCERAHDLGAKKVVFHAGYYSKMDPEEAFQNIKKQILELKKKNKWKVKLLVEVMGKVNVFGSLDEVLRLSEETKCGICVDFAHLKAINNGKLNIKETLSKIKKYKNIHAHYSGINYGSKGEKNHIPINVKEWEILAKALKKSKLNFTVICESPDTIKDTIKMRKILDLQN
jgi:deoxyribonuclease IV